jgi:hypothetical protein
MTFYGAVFNSVMGVWVESCALISSFPRERAIFKFKTVITPFISVLYVASGVDAIEIEQCLFSYKKPTAITCRIF